MTISFIIPVFNAEKFIERCIKSVISQNINANDFEIIAVNDGSEDNSLDVLQRLSLLFGNIKIINTQNKGAGAARNTGLQNSTGEIVTFVDADDYLNPSCFPSFIELFLTDKLDILGFETKSVRGRKTHITRSLCGDYGTVLTGEQMILKYTNGFGPCGKLYRKGLFFENNLFFLEGIIPEDIELVPRLFLAAKRIKIIEIPAYNYEYNPDSVTKRRNTKIYLKRIEGLLVVILSLKNVADSYHNKNIEISNYLSEKIINKCILELYYFINYKVVLDYKCLENTRKYLTKNNLIPVKLSNEQIIESYLINHNWLHLILYYTHLIKLHGLFRRVLNKSINVITNKMCFRHEF